MNPIIPVFGTFTLEAQTQWIESLSALLPSVRFVALQDLTEPEKQSVTVAVVANPSADDIASLPALVWVQSAWAGVESLVQYFKQSPIKVVRLQDPALAETMAEAALTWTLFLHRNMHIYAAQQRQQHWQQHDYLPPQKRNIAVIGVGNMGKAIVNKLEPHGFNLLGWSRTEKIDSSYEVYFGEDQFADILSKSDVVISVLPDTASTQGLFNQTAFAAMKPGCQFINFGRGSAVVEKDLVAALDTGHLEHAVLDVFLEEPLLSQHPFWTHPHITVLPHVSAQTRIDTGSVIAADTIKTYLSSGELPHHVDFERGY